jgi:hypothetical protein
MGANGVRRWEKHFKDGNKDIADRLPLVAYELPVLTERTRKIDVLVTDNRNMAVK